MKSFIVIGLGRFGSSVAKELYRLGHEVLAVDWQEELVNAISGSVTHAVTCDARDEGALRALGAKNFDCAVVGIGTDVAASSIITVTLNEMGVKQIICKANNDTHKKLLEKLGADKVVIPEREMAEKLARSLSSTNVLDFIELSSSFGFAEIPAPKSWIGKNMGEIGIRARYGISVIAVKDSGGPLVAPGADYIVLKESVLAVVGNYKNIEALQKL